MWPFSSQLSRHMNTDRQAAHCCTASWLWQRLRQTRTLHRPYRATDPTGRSAPPNVWVIQSQQRAPTNTTTTAVTYFLSVQRDHRHGVAIIKCRKLSFAFTNFSTRYFRDTQCMRQVTNYTGCASKTNPLKILYFSNGSTNFSQTFRLCTRVLINISRKFYWNN